MRNAEILVVGLGAMGSAVLYHLARLGAAPVGIEQYQVGHALGSSHGHSRVFRTFYHDPLYTTLAEAALPLWQELEALSGEKLLELTGSLHFARPGNESIQRNISVMQALHRPFELLTAAEVATRFPVVRLPEDTVACFAPQGGFLDAGRCVQTNLLQAQRFGATIHERVRVDRVDLSQEWPELETSEGRYRCARLIITPGPWASEVMKELALPLQVTRQQKFYFQPKDRAAYQPHRLPVFADSDAHFYGFPEYGLGMKVADDQLGPVVSPHNIDRTLDLGKRDQLKRWLETIMPDGEFSFASGATCMYTMTPDRDFLIGPHPQNRNVLVGAGFSGHGFKFSTLVGKILAELATDGATGYPIGRFRLDRFDEGAH